MLWLPPGPAGRGYVFTAVVDDTVVTAVVLWPDVVDLLSEEDAVVGTVVMGAVVCVVGKVLCAADVVVSETVAQDVSDPSDTGSSPAAHPLTSSPARQSAKRFRDFFFISVHLIVLAWRYGQKHEARRPSASDPYQYDRQYQNQPVSPLRRRIRYPPADNPESNRAAGSCRPSTAGYLR